MEAVEDPLFYLLIKHRGSHLHALRPARCQIRGVLRRNCAANKAKAILDNDLYRFLPLPIAKLANPSSYFQTRSVAVKTRSRPRSRRFHNRPRHRRFPRKRYKPPVCVDPIPLSMRIIVELQDYVKERVGEEQYVIMACWAFPSAEPREKTSKCVSNSTL